MNLQQTKESLEQNGIAIALDVGVHRYCDINSNCPLAVELRRVIHDAGITLEQLLTAFAESQEPVPDPLHNPEFAQFSGKAEIYIGGTPVEIDLSEAIRGEAQAAFRYKVEKLYEKELRLGRIGRSLYDTYLNQIWELRNTRTLPQLTFTLEAMIKAGCLITTDGGNYIFLFPRDYNPQWIVTNGVRYKIADKDIIAIVKSAYIQYTITKEGKILHTFILNSDGSKLHHYHGAGGDCWGNVHVPKRWDGTLRSLTNLTTQIMGSLATVNKDSLMSHHPPHMPNIDDVFNRSTKLGEEGYMEEREQPEGGWGVDHDREPMTEDIDGTTPRRWGQRREQAQQGTPEEETPMMVRFGTTEMPDNIDVVCALCGERYGDHYRGRDIYDPICPRDH